MGKGQIERAAAAGRSGRPAGGCAARAKDNAADQVTLMPELRTTGPYIPRADGPLRDWLNNFAAVAAREAGALGLTGAQAAMLGELAERYEAAFVRATSPGTR